MLKINQFYWNLYKESPEGKKTIEKFEKASNDDFSIDDSIRMLEYFDPEWLLNIAVTHASRFSFAIYPKRSAPNSAN